MDYTEDINQLSDHHKQVIQEQIGKTYGMLTIDSFAFRNETILYFNCTCSCGNKKTVSLKSLKKGDTKSCGCLVRDDFDPTGMKIGMLTVLGPDSLRRYHYLCHCDCGRERSIQKAALKHGLATHCGCQTEKNRALGRQRNNERFHNGELAIKPQDLTGRRFGRLTVLEKIPSPVKAGLNVPYRCICDCGKEIQSTYGVLMKGGTRSCGCLASDTRKKIVVLAQAANGLVEGTSVRLIKEAMEGKLLPQNTSGVRGVYIRDGKYVAQIKFKGKQYRLGEYKSLEVAKKARKAAEEKLFGEFLDDYDKESVEKYWQEKVEQALKEIRELHKEMERQQNG